MDSLQEKSKLCEKTINENSVRLSEIKKEKNDLTELYESKQVELGTDKNECEQLKKTVKEYKSYLSKYKSVCSIYADTAVADPQMVAEKIRIRIADTVVNLHELERQVEELDKK